MSDPLKKDEIEDVLSSIRRLVSEDARAISEPEAVAPKEKPSPAAADKLVLTPSLRIEEDAAAPEASDDMSGDTLAQDAAEALGEPSQEQGPRVLTLSKTAADTPAPPEGAAVSPEILKGQEPSEAPVHEAPARSEVSPQQDAGTPVSHQPDAQNAEGDDAQEMPAVEWQSVRSYADMEFDPEAAGDGDYAGTEVDRIDWGQPTDAGASLSRPDAAPVDATEDVIEAEVVESASEEDAPYEAVLDEEMLRDLVGEIVRQELQGPLGERITRNVRKLVRREINRALASRQMD